MPIELSKSETEDAAGSLKRFLREELELELGDMRTNYLLKFFMEELAPLAYNKGVADAEAFLRTRLEDLGAVCHEPPMTFWTRTRKGR